MKSLFYNISQVLGISIIHSLWQGLLVYVLLKLLFIIRPSLSAHKKYRLLFIGLAALTVWFAGTFFIETKDYNWSLNTLTPVLPNNFHQTQISTIPSPALHISQSFFSGFQQSIYRILKIYLPYISVLYIIGLVINLIRLAYAWEKIRFIKQGMTAADTLQKQVSNFSRQMAITKNVRLHLSKLVDIPCTIGYLKPILLLPVTLTTQLSAEEVEAILLHELSHIKHNDYLLNLIQQVMAILLFMNPFAQLISRMINLERENRCDDLVVNITGAPLIYAHALVKLENVRQADTQLILAATGQKQHLFSRVERIMKQKKPAVNVRHLVLALIIFIGSIGSIAWLNPEVKNGKIVSKHGAQAIHQLTAMVKHVIAPAKVDNEHNSDSIGKSPVITQLIRNITGNNKLADTAKKPIEIIAKSDTNVITVSEREKLLAQYRQSERDLTLANKNLEALPVYKEYIAARKLLDSMRKIILVPTPELLQKGQEDKKEWDDFNNSPQQLKKVAEYQRLLRIYSLAMDAEPESIQFKKDQDRQRDSVLNKIQQSTGLSKEQIKRTNPEYRQWLIASGKEGDILKLKLQSNPEIKIKADSLLYATQQLYSGPEFEAVNKKTSVSQEQLEAGTPPALNKYQSAYREAINKVNTTPEWKNYMDEINKNNILVEKLKYKLIP